MTQDKIYNGLYNIFSLDSQEHNEYGVDWASIDEILEKIFYVGGVIIAILATMIAILYTQVVCFELLYLAVPMFRVNVDDAARNNERVESIFSVAIRDARKALELANTTKTGVQPFGIYLRLKIKQFIIVALQLWVAINIDIFVNLVLNLVGPMMDVLKGIMYK